jgi:cytochrome c oxidase assembly protein subunit 15
MSFRKRLNMTSPTASKASSSHLAYRPSPHWMAVFAALFTFPLLLVGGSVTTYRVGLAVPDWPTTFGINMFLYDFWNAPFGVRIEHTHRLYAAAVGLATIGLCVWFLIFEPRRWMKWLGALALLAVIAQGVLGGTRVTQVSTFLAAVHGSTAMAYFGLMVALCVLTGRAWYSDHPPAIDRHHLRPLSLLLLGLVCVQIGFGAWLRHYGSAFALLSHVGMALFVVFFALFLAFRVHRAGRDATQLLPSARLLGCGVLAQSALGVLAFVGLLPWDGLPHPVRFYDAVFRTGHQSCAAIVLASTVVLALRAARLYRPGVELAIDDAETAADFHQPLAADSAPRSLPENLEVVA